MKIYKLILKEIQLRLTGFLCGSLIVSVCLSSVIISISLLRNFDLETVKILEKHEKASAASMQKLENKIRKDMKGLGFNIYIFPEGQDMHEVYSQGFASKTMPENYVDKLAGTKTLSKINHLFPSLTQKMTWPEQKRTIVLIGIKGEVPVVHRASESKKKQPLIHPVSGGKAIIGFELQQSLNLQAGDEISILGKNFEIHETNEERGSIDDITIWINLDECQQLLNKPEQINAILALECNCASLDRLGEIRNEIQAILPGTQVIEVKSTALARAEARMAAKKTTDEQISLIKKQRSSVKGKLKENSGMIIVSSSFLSIIAVWALMVNNVSQRRHEIGIFRSMGCKDPVILKLILGRSFLMGVSGTLLAFFGAPLLFLIFGLKPMELTSLISGSEVILIILTGPVLSLLGSLYPCQKANLQDPATALMNEA